MCASAWFKIRFLSGDEILMRAERMSNARKTQPPFMKEDKPAHGGKFLMWPWCWWWWTLVWYGEWAVICNMMGYKHRERIMWSIQNRGYTQVSIGHSTWLKWKGDYELELRGKRENFSGVDARNFKRVLLSGEERGKVDLEFFSRMLYIFSPR